MSYNILILQNIEPWFNIFCDIINPSSIYFCKILTIHIKYGNVRIWTPSPQGIWNRYCGLDILNLLSNRNWIAEVGLKYHGHNRLNLGFNIVLAGSIYRGVQNITWHRYHYFFRNLLLGYYLKWRFVIISQFHYVFTNEIYSFIYIIYPILLFH